MAVAVPVAVLPTAGQARAAGLPDNCQLADDGMVTCTYTEAGSYSFQVPEGVTSLDVTADGAAGGTGSYEDAEPGGQGASVQATAVSVNPGAALTVAVGAPGEPGIENTHGGAGGSPGGGAGGDPEGSNYLTWAGGGGGGYSGLLDGTTPLLIAAGGGGSGDLAGGDGGEVGAPGMEQPPEDCPTEGHGCGGDEGGAGGMGGAGAIGYEDSGSGESGSAGNELAGGQGGSTTAGDRMNSSGGGGGGGYVGGGGGGSGLYAGGGGGGSSFGPADSVFGLADTEPQVVISYIQPAPSPTPKPTTPARPATLVPHPPSHRVPVTG